MSGSTGLRRSSRQAAASPAPTPPSSAVLPRWRARQSNNENVPPPNVAQQTPGPTLRPPGTGVPLQNIGNFALSGLQHSSPSYRDVFRHWQASSSSPSTHLSSERSRPSRRGPTGVQTPPATQNRRHLQGAASTSTGLLTPVATQRRVGPALPTPPATQSNTLSDPPSTTDSTLEAESARIRNLARNSAYATPQGSPRRRRVQRVRLDDSESSASESDASMTSTSRPRTTRVSSARQEGMVRRRSPTRNGQIPRRRLFLAARTQYLESKVPRHDLGRMDVPCPHCGALHWLIERTDGSIGSPLFGTCCRKGRVRIPLLEQPPQPLQLLLTAQTLQAKAFRNDLWKYNRAFSFTSLGVLEDHAINNGSSAPVFRICGELHHNSAALTPTGGRTPKYAQLYIYEPQAALQHRINQNEDLDSGIMAQLQAMLLASNRFAHLYRSAYQIMTREGQPPDVSVRLRLLQGQDRRRYNTPTSDEFAVVVPDRQGNEQGRDIILRLHGGGLHRISDLHPAYAPLQYPLLFPYGERGWSPDLKLKKAGDFTADSNERLSQTEYAAFRIHYRPNEGQSLIRGGRLFTRYIVDMWASADQNRLRFLRDHQKELRAELYSGLEDAIGTEDHSDLNQLGRRVVLPSSYIGGPRNMMQRYQDAMAVARHFRRVDLFITMTTNPQWEEITRELLPGQTAYDRPDLVARVFEMKKDALLEDIYKNGIFGNAVAYVYTIEFQKRGLPHVHILVFLDTPYKLSTVDAIDSCIRAYWPDPFTEPRLFETVKNCMVHGPCGALNPRAPCMDNGKCTKNFPKPFQPATEMNDDGFPKYRRPDDGRRYPIGVHWVDNRWIVPYCPYLSSKYDCHINVECAASLGSIGYVVKYMEKGPDRATLEIMRQQTGRDIEVNENDEIQRWVLGRYISAPESVWRILHFWIHKQIPSVERLQVHLPGQHMVTFDPDEDVRTVMERASQERTTLTAFFNANADDGELGVVARQCTYQEFPQKFVWDSRSRRWKIRQRGFSLGRMVFVPPNGGERFYLRTLLTVVRGARSFQDLRTYDGIEYPTFREACLARGLLEDDGEWRQCLQEAAEMGTGTRLRHLFVVILLFCAPSQPEVLWEQFRERMCDNLRYRLQNSGIVNPTEEQVYDYGLYMINNLLSESGRSLEDWPSMPQPIMDWDDLQENPLIAEQRNYDPEAEQQSLITRLALLNNEQRAAYDEIVHSVEGNEGRLFFLHGSGGTGKTFVYKTVCNRIRSNGSIVLCVASSGIAALLLPGGRTAHSMFRIPVGTLHEDSLCDIAKRSPRADLLCQTRLIIWDEAVPQHRYAFEALDRTCRDIRDNDSPFGGITVVFGGDFQQTLPVVRRGSREGIVGATIRYSYLWEHIHVLHLRQNMRLDAQDPSSIGFAQWLIDVGHGQNLSDDNHLDFPQDMRSPSSNSLINFIYPGIDSPTPPPAQYFLDRMILAPRNADVSDLNEGILDKMAGQKRTYVSADELLTESSASHPVPIEFLRTVNASGLPPGELSMKLGSPLILLRNLSPKHGLCNGTRMVVTRMSDRVLEVQIIGGECNGDRVFIPRISLIPSDNDDILIKFRRRQFPVRLAFALTINKAQGQSVKYVGLDLRNPVFAHGQLYVALSRATSRQRIKVLLPDGEQECSTPNVVYPEVLLA
ncbi:transcriptional factor B3 [Coprinopsis cinerea okayama7|uniref:ATP-dependent DNA helicase n=1 Tax=Coprinopsis cinerea (strain Okayama-7 / 130 / ATCC MYA-4618 / FGSC 9003) TaxID=240176 RepID=A8NPE0_COPC7|nr:transcriptional factor B3 [Coprinopsis cinerea okayama7\|eukprot:XP_001835316.2 transcriptional factor B3 [Coprinopsis cinerea okayama7\